jgi:hypothetical protein
LYDKALRLLLVGLLPAPLLAGAGCDPANRPPGPGTAPAGAASLSTEVAVSLPVQGPVPGRWPAAAFDGTQYLVVWEDLRAGRPILYGARVGADGAALDPSGFPILDTFADDDDFSAYEPAVAFDGDNFLVVVETAGRLLGVRVSRGGEVLDPGGIAITTAAQGASRPSLLFDGQQYLVAWTQAGDDSSPGRAVYWARVQTDGTVLDPDGVRGDPASDAAVGLSFDGTNYLLSWMSRDGESDTKAIFAARIAPDGTRIDAGAIRISPAGVDVDPELDPASPVSSFDGTSHVVLWYGYFDGSEGQAIQVMVTRVTPGRTVLDPDGILVASVWSPLHRLAIAADDGRSILAWSMDDWIGPPPSKPIEMAVVAADGTVSPHPASAFASGEEATLVAHPAGALLLWRDPAEPFADHPGIRGARLDATGAPVADGAVTPSLTASSQSVRAAASDGQSYFVVWADTSLPGLDGPGLMGARIAADGTPLDAEGIPLTTEAAERVEVVFDGASFVVTWLVSKDGDGPVQAVRVSPEGELLDAEPLSSPLGSFVIDMAAASDGTHTLLVGQLGDMDEELAVVLLDQDGAAASELRPIAGVTRFLRSSPAVSFDGAGYLVVWSGENQIFGRRVGADGVPVGQRFEISDDGQTHHCPRVASGGGNHLVVWHDAGNDSILARRVSQSGEVLDPAGLLIAPSTDASYPKCPSVAFNGKRFVVAWSASSADDGGLSDLHGAEVGLDGEVLPPFAISEEPESEGRAFLAAGDDGEDGQVLVAYDRFVPGAPYDSQRAHARFLVPESEPARGGGCQIGPSGPAPAPPLWLLGGVIALWLVRRRSVR